MQINQRRDSTEDAKVQDLFRPGCDNEILQWDAARAHLRALPRATISDLIQWLDSGVGPMECSTDGSQLRKSSPATAAVHAARSLLAVQMRRKHLDLRLCP